MGQHVPLAFPDKVPMASGDDRMVSPAEVEEPPDATQAFHEEARPANDIEVEEVVQYPVDEKEIRDQANPTERQPILLGMAASMSQHGAYVAMQEASPAVPDEEQEVPVPADNQEADGRMNSLTERQEEHVQTVGPDDQPDQQPVDGGAGQEAMPITAGEAPEKYEVSPSTLVSSLQMSSVEQRTSGRGRGNVSPGSEREHQGNVGSAIISSFELEQEE